MASLTPLSKGLIGLAVVGAMASAVWHLVLKERFGAAPTSSTATSTSKPWSMEPTISPATSTRAPRARCSKPFMLLLAADQAGAVPFRRSRVPAHR